MADPNGPVIDMTPDGRFIEPPKLSWGAILVRLALFGLFLAVGAMVFWTLLFMIPVLLVLGIIGYIAARSRLRRF